MAQELTKKERGFVRDVVKTGNATKAALNNYDISITAKDRENVAASIGSQNLRKLKIKKSIAPVLERYRKELNEILSAMELKDKNGEDYKTLVEASDKIQKQIQLLSGGATENIAVKPIYGGTSITK